MQANLNRVSQATLTQLSYLAHQNGMSVEDYHEQVLDYWIKSPANLSKVKVDDKTPYQSRLTLTPKQQKIPNIQQAITNSPAFINNLLTMPKIDGHEDLFERCEESRDIDVDDLELDKFDKAK